MQVKYPNKSTPTHWDPVHLTYPVRKFPETGQSSETIARRLRGEPEVLKPPKTKCYEVKGYDVDHTVRNDLLRSQTTVDYSYKVPETKIFNKHTSCVSNNYIYPPPKNLSDRVPDIRAHGVSETRDKYGSPVLDSKLVTQEQFETHHSLDPCGPILSKEIEPLFFSYDGFEKYLDPYVTTSRLHHRLFTAEQTDRTGDRDIVTYYTCSNTPWVRSRKPCTAEWSLPKRGAKSMYDREKFKNEFREIRTHNKLNWIPNAFRTEVRDNFAPKPGQLDSKVHSGEEQVRAFRSKTMASLTRGLEEDLSMKRMYITENAFVGSRKPLCSVFDPYVEINKRLARKTK